MENEHNAGRVRRHSAEAINRRIELQIQKNISYYREHPQEIEARLRELDREWDVERALEAHAATIALVGTVLGVVRRRGFFSLPLLVGGFLLQHAVQGWCPPLPIIRRLGFRTQREIDEEIFALRGLQGRGKGTPVGVVAPI